MTIYYIMICIFRNFCKNATRKKGCRNPRYRKGSEDKQDKGYEPITLSLISFTLTQTLSQICRILQPYGPEFTLEYSAFQQAY